MTEIGAETPPPTVTEAGKRGSFGWKQSIRLTFNIANQCVAKTLIAPYERVKILQQLSPLLPVTGFVRSHEGLGTFQMLSLLVRRDGFFSLWQGNVSGCLSVVPGVLIREFVDPHLRPLIVRHDPHNMEELVAEGVITTLRLLLAHPFSVLHTRMICDTGGTHNGLNSYVYSIVNVHGLFGVYRGVTLALMVALIQKASFILLTEYFRGYTIENLNEQHHLIREGDEMRAQERKEDEESRKSALHSAASFMNKQFYNWGLSHVCTHFSSIFTYPLETVSKGCMALDIPITRCFHKMTANGNLTLYRGLGTHFLAGTCFSMVLIGLTRVKWYWLQSRRRKENKYHVMHETH